MSLQNPVSKRNFFPVSGKKEVAIASMAARCVYKGNARINHTQRRNIPQRGRVIQVNPLSECRDKVGGLNAVAFNHSLSGVEANNPASAPFSRRQRRSIGARFRQGLH